jgi:hypothetical protein
MSRHTLTATFEFAALVKPTAQSVNDDDLVPEGAPRLDGAHRRHRQIEHRQIVVDIGLIGTSRLGSSADLAPDSILIAART